MNYLGLSTIFRRSGQSLTLLFLLAPGSPALAFELTLQLQDEAGNPVGQAVVEARQSPFQENDSTTAIIDQVDREFIPMVLLINPGQQVSFPNSDNVRHHVYSFSAIKEFSTRLYADEEVQPVQFDTPGIAILGCNIHDSMVAYVYVSEWQHAAVTDELGRATLIDMPTDPQTIHIWHPWLQTPDNSYQLDVSAHSDGDTVEINLPIVNPEQSFGFRALLPATES